MPTAQHKRPLLDEGQECVIIINGLDVITLSLKRGLLKTRASVAMLEKKKKIRVHYKFSLCR